MKRLLLTVALCVATTAGLSANAQGDRVSTVPVTADSVDLTTRQISLPSYGQSVSALLASDDDALREAGLRHVIRDGAATNFQRTDVLNVVRIYRDHADDNMRRMAVVALGQMNDAWAMEFLTRSTIFEKTPQVLHTLLAVIDAANAPTPVDVDGALARETR